MRRTRKLKNFVSLMYRSFARLLVLAGIHGPLLGLALLGLLRGLLLSLAVLRLGLRLGLLLRLGFRVRGGLLGLGVGSGGLVPAARALLRCRALRLWRLEGKWKEGGRERGELESDACSPPPPTIFLMVFSRKAVTSGLSAKPAKEERRFLARMRSARQRYVASLMLQYSRSTSCSGSICSMASEKNSSAAGAVLREGWWVEGEMWGRCFGADQRTACPRRRRPWCRGRSSKSW